MKKKRPNKFRNRIFPACAIPRATPPAPYRPLISPSPATRPLCCHAISSPALPTPPIPNPLLRQTSPRASHSQLLAPANFPRPSVRTAR